MFVHILSYNHNIEVGFHMARISSPDVNVWERPIIRHIKTTGNPNNLGLIKYWCTWGYFNVTGCVLHGNDPAKVGPKTWAKMVLRRWRTEEQEKRMSKGVQTDIRLSASVDDENNSAIESFVLQQRASTINQMVFNVTGRHWMNVFCTLSVYHIHALNKHGANTN